MASEYRYVLTQKAVDDVDGIVSYTLRELENGTAAGHFLDMLQTAIDEACAFPDSGTPVINEYLPNTSVRSKTVGSYIMYYLPDYPAEVIQILRIVYGRRNLDEIIRSLQPD